MPVVTCIADLRALSKRRVARAIFQYVDRGSCADLESLVLRQRVGIDVDKRSTAGTMLGEQVAASLIERARAAAARRSCSRSIRSRASATAT